MTLTNVFSQPLPETLGKAQLLNTKHLYLETLQEWVIYIRVKLPEKSPLELQTCLVIILHGMYRGSCNISELNQVLKTEKQGEPFRGHGSHPPVASADLQLQCVKGKLLSQCKRIKALWTQK